eukprot:gene3995-12819_t
MPPLSAEQQGQLAAKVKHAALPRLATGRTAGTARRGEATATRRGRPDATRHGNTGQRGATRRRRQQTDALFADCAGETLQQELALEQLPPTLAESFAEVVSQRELEGTAAGHLGAKTTCFRIAGSEAAFVGVRGVVPWSAADVGRAALA